MQFGDGTQYGTSEPQGAGISVTTSAVYNYQATAYTAGVSPISLSVIINNLFSRSAIGNIIGFGVGVINNISNLLSTSAINNITGSVIGTEILTAFTKVDPNSHISVSTARATLSSLSRNEIVYLYYDFGAGYFGNFTHIFDLAITAGNSSTGVAILWGMNNAVEDYSQWGSSGLDIQLNALAASPGVLLLREGISGNSTAYTNIVFNTVYYLTVQRSGTALTCKIYSDSARTVLITTLSLTVASTAYRYFYSVVSYYDGGSGVISGYGENYSLN